MKEGGDSARKARAEGGPTQGSPAPNVKKKRATKATPEAARQEPAPGVPVYPGYAPGALGNAPKTAAQD